MRSRILRSLSESEYANSFVYADVARSAMSCADSSIVSSETWRFFARSWTSSSRFATRRFLTRSPVSFFRVLAAAIAAAFGDIWSSPSRSLGIRDAGKRRGRPVNLFRQDQPCQLMWQGHPGKAEDSTRPRVQDSVETVRPAHREDHGRRRRIEPGAQVGRKFRARALLAFLVQEDQEIARREGGDEALRLLRANAGGVGLRAGFFIPDDDDVACGEPADPPDVSLDAPGVLGLVALADEEKPDPHELVRLA